MSFEGYPLFRMNRLVCKFWVLGGALRAQVATTVSRTYRTGVVMLSPTLWPIGIVDPAGNTRDLPPPFTKQFRMADICNKPSTRYSECACRNFYDPESGGPWGLRDRERAREIHHPHCQFERKAAPAFEIAQKSAFARLERGLSPQARPDEWIRQRAEL